MYPKQFNPYNYSLGTMNKDENVERRETIRIDERGREDEEEEEKKIDTFFKLIKHYQEARKRRREELAENSGDVRKKSNGGERSGIVVPAFQPEDFSECRTDLKTLMTVSDHKEEITKVKEEEEKAEERNEDKGKPFAGYFQENERRIVLFGLDGTGKSSIMHKLKTGETLTTNMPTVGFEVESIKYKDSTLSFWEMGGQQRYKLFPLWKHYFQEIAGLVLVVDSTDRDRIEEAKDFLNMVIDEIQGSVPDNAAVLVYGNKQEVPGAMSASEITNKLDLTSLRQKNWQRNWHTQSSCALSGDGLHEGLDWLLKNAGRM